MSVDSKSFRNMFIQFMLDKNINSTAIAKNCGTSTTMIDKHYTANSALDSIMDSWLGWCSWKYSLFEKNEAYI